MSAGSDLVTFINAQSLATFGTNLFPNTMPDQPDGCVVVYDTPGSPSLKAGGPTTAAKIHGFQVVVRDPVDSAAAALAQSIFDMVEASAPTTISGYLHTTALQPPFKLKTDENGRHYFAFNGQAWQ